MKKLPLTESAQSPASDSLRAKILPIGVLGRHGLSGAMTGKLWTTGNLRNLGNRLPPSVTRLATLVLTFTATIAFGQQSLLHPGDPIIASSENSPPSLGAANAIDGTSAPYVNFDSAYDAKPSGFVVSPSVGMTVVTGIAVTPVGSDLYSAPKEITLEGSNDSTITSFDSGTWELMVRFENISPPPYANRPQAFFFGNSKAYRNYRWTAIHTQGPSGCCLDIAEVQLLGITNVGTGSAPFIFTQPKSQTVTTGGTAVFAVAAFGAPPFFYQWSKDGTNLGGTLGSSLVLSNVQPNQAGSYSVTLTNSYGAAVSADAFLTVVEQSLSRPSEGLVGWWPAEGDANDVFGLSDGALVNGVTFAPGMVGQAFSFEQPDQYVEFPDSRLLTPYSLTAEWWVFPEALPEADSMVVSKGPYFQVQLHQLNPAQSNMVLYALAQVGTNVAVLQGINPVPLGQWTHVAVTLDWLGFALYENGLLDISGAGVMFGTDWRGPQPWRLGGGTAAAFQGRLDEFSFYNRVLTLAEVQNIYALGKAGAILPPEIVSQPKSLSVGMGTDASFSLIAESPGNTPLDYQWQFNRENIPGQTNRTLLFTNLQPAQSGDYQVLVSNAGGTVSSATASLAVAGVVAWGSDSWGEGNVPAGLVNVIAVSAGGKHSLALKADGTVVGWGGNDAGQASPPPGQTNIVAICAGGSHSLALKADGTVVAWGGNFYGEATVPPGQSNVVAISAGDQYSLALKSDGTVIGWGRNDWGQASPPADLMGVVAISAASMHSLALKSDGSVVAWGRDYLTAVPAGLSNVVEIAAGLFQSLALRSDGTIVGWGQMIAPSLSNVVAIATGQILSLALLADGSVISWGWPFYGSLDPPVGLPNAVAIAAGWSHGLALLRDGTPQMTVQPWDQSVPAGGTSSFTAKTAGSQSMAYQWLFNGNSLAGATNDSLTISNAQPGAAGLYSLTAYNQLGTTVSRQAQLTVIPLPPDNDGDGIPDDWEIAHGLNPNDPSDALVSTRGDGFSNLMRYALGMETNNPATGTRPIAPTVHVSNNGERHLSIVFKRRKLTPGLQYIAEVSGDRQTWYSDASHVQVVGSNSLDDQFDLVTVQDLTPVTPSTPRAFRIRIVR